MAATTTLDLENSLLQAWLELDADRRDLIAQLSVNHINARLRDLAQLKRCWFGHNSDTIMECSCNWTPEETVEKIGEEAIEDAIDTEYMVTELANEIDQCIRFEYGADELLDGFMAKHWRRLPEIVRAIAGSEIMRWSILDAPEPSSAEDWDQEASGQTFNRFWEYFISE